MKMNTAKRKNIKDEKWYWKYMEEYFGISKGGKNDISLSQNNDFDFEHCVNTDISDLDEKTCKEIREAIESNYESEPLNL